LGSIISMCSLHVILLSKITPRYFIRGVHGSVVGWGTIQQAGRSQFRFPMRSLDFFNWPNPSSRTMALGSAESLTEMSTRNLPWGKGRSERKVVNLTAVRELRRFRILWASTACCRDSFNFTFFIFMFDKGDIPFIQYMMSLRGPKSMRKVDDLSLNWFLCSSAHATSQ
jgi:hypothetical protein